MVIETRKIVAKRPKLRLILNLFIATFFFSSYLLAFASSQLTEAIELYKKRDFQQALDLLTQVCKSTPNPTAFSYAANCLYNLNRKPEAIELYWFVTKKYPTAKEAYACRAFLKQIDTDYARNASSRGQVQLPKEFETQTARAAKPNTRAGWRRV